MLKRNMACLQKNMQPRGGFGEKSYRGKGRQIMQRAGDQNSRGEALNNQGGQRLKRNSNIMNIDRGRERDKMCYIYGK